MLARISGGVPCSICTKTEHDARKMSKYVLRVTFMCGIACTEGQVRLPVCFLQDVK